MVLQPLFDPYLGSCTFGEAGDTAGDIHDVYIFPDLKLFVRKFAYDGNVQDLLGYVTIFDPNRFDWFLEIDGETRQWVRIG